MERGAFYIALGGYPFPNETGKGEYGNIIPFPKKAQTDISSIKWSEEDQDTYDTIETAQTLENEPIIKERTEDMGEEFFEKYLDQRFANIDDKISNIKEEKSPAT